MLNDLRIMLDLYEFSDYVKDPSSCQRIKVESLLNMILLAINTLMIIVGTPRLDSLL